jgi:hypothetical protein
MKRKFSLAVVLIIGVAESKKAKFEMTYTSRARFEKYAHEILSITPKAEKLLSCLMVSSPAGK